MHVLHVDENHPLLLEHLAQAGFKNTLAYKQSKEDISIWTIAEPEDIRLFQESGLLTQKFEKFPMNYSKIIGFIDMFKNGKEMVFRIKDVSQMACKNT